LTLDMPDTLASRKRRIVRCDRGAPESSAPPMQAGYYVGTLDGARVGREFMRRKTASETGESGRAMRSMIRCD
jgi:hypothetical protein